MTYCHHTAYCMFHDTMSKIVDAPLTIIFKMRHRPGHLPFSQYCRRIHLLWNDVTMQPIHCWMCKTWNCWHSVDPRINHIETAFVYSIIVCNESYIHHWHPVLCLNVLSFASRSFVTSWFLINCYLHYLSEKWREPITFTRFWPAIDGM